MLYTCTAKSLIILKCDQSRAQNFLYSLGDGNFYENSIDKETKMKYTNAQL